MEEGQYGQYRSGIVRVVHGGGERDSEGIVVQGCVGRCCEGGGVVRESMRMDNEGGMWGWLVEDGEVGEGVLVEESVEREGDGGWTVIQCCDGSSRG